MTIPPQIPPLTVVSTHQGWLDYVEAARQKPPSDWERLWLEYAVEP